MYVTKLRKYAYLISLLLILPGLVSLFIQGLNLGIDFTGGSLIHVQFEKPVKMEQIRNVLGQYEIDRGVPIQQAGNNEYIIRTPILTEQQSSQLVQGFRDHLGNLDVLRIDEVGAVIGKELTNKALMAIGIACVLMLIYITIRFEFKFGVGAVVALLQNVVIVVGVFSLFQWEVDSTFIAALLTILGYSINDTIVVFDRIRENLKLRRREPYDVIVDKSVLQTVNRSINTVLTVVFCLGALLLLGGATLKYFVLAMLIGIVVGCFSSIFIASPIWYDLKIREN
ncbi:MAG: protein translocase subunit SecF [Syntrophomonadaceae bacterium]|jgi:preprotein translocase subunit SecF|nr:protein translocase subunit SecF [Syntrophomonadaceae bacterium]